MTCMLQSKGRAGNLRVTPRLVSQTGATTYRHKGRNGRHEREGVSTLAPQRRAGAGGRRRRRQLRHALWDDAELLHLPVQHRTLHPQGAAAPWARHDPAGLMQNALRTCSLSASAKVRPEVGQGNSQLLMLAQAPIKGRFANAENLGGFLPVPVGCRQYPLNVFPLDIRQGPMGQIRLFSFVSVSQFRGWDAVPVRAACIPGTWAICPTCAQRRVDPRPQLPGRGLTERGPAGGEPRRIGHLRRTTGSGGRKPPGRSLLRRIAARHRPTCGWRQVG